MLTVIATTCVAAVCGGTKSSVCLHNSYNKGTPTRRSLPRLPGASHGARYLGRVQVSELMRVELGKLLCKFLRVGTKAFSIRP